MKSMGDLLSDFKPPEREPGNAARKPRVRAGRRTAVLPPLRCACAVTCAVVARVRAARSKRSSA